MNNVKDVNIRWDDPNTIEAGFRIYRKIPGSDYILRTTLPPSTESFTDVGLNIGDVVEYKICAFTPNSEACAEVSITVSDSVRYLYGGDSSGNVFRHDLLTGETSKWQIHGNQRLFGVIGNGAGDVFSISQWGKIIKTNNGVVNWEFTHPSFYSYGIDLDQSETFVYTCGRDGYVRKLDTTNGDIIWESNIIPGLSKSSIISFDVFLYVATGYGSNYGIYKIHEDDGEILWGYEGYSGRVMNITVDSMGSVVAGSYDRTLKKISSNGQLEWSVPTDGIGMGTAIDSIGGVYVMTTNDKIMKFDTAGLHQWTINHPWNYQNSLSDDDGVGDIIIDDKSNTLYAPTKNGSVIAYDIDGNIINNIQINTTNIPIVTVSVK